MGTGTVSVLGWHCGHSVVKATLQCPWSVATSVVHEKPSCMWTCGCLIRTWTSQNCVIDVPISSEALVKGHRSVPAAARSLVDMCLHERKHGHGLARCHFPSRWPWVCPDRRRLKGEAPRKACRTEQLHAGKKKDVAKVSILCLSARTPLRAPSSLRTICKCVFMASLLKPSCGFRASFHHELL